MSLTSDLISEFVKITKDDKKTNSEATVYGTAVEHDGVVYVRLDGSDQLTPMVTTTVVEPGERVTVMIKNHTATVTGNISSPATRIDDTNEIIDKITDVEILVADKVSTKDFDAEIARIEKLVAGDVNVEGRLTANEAHIKELQANDVTITGRLDAAEADIDSLSTNKLDADVADITYATIKNLEATNADVHNLSATYGEFKTLTTDKLAAIDGSITNLQTKKLDAETADITYAKIANLEAIDADITNLEADVADIDTLIFGSASGTTIQTAFSNAVIAQLGDAQIKSAMIKSVSADKITAGDIITNNVRVMSEDGKLLISDETIQISDSTRVRVQIGKDTADDYSISIWDTDGNLMFSKGGITDSAIKNAIIRNDMVSDTANISATKLNIDSLFTVINEDESNTLNSSKVLIDADNQTLDVAFKSMTTKVETAQSTANAAQATANQNASDMATIITDFNADIADLQNQIDGSITTWFYEVAPTVENEPAVEWTTTDIKNNHLGDLYYDTTTGYCYRWQVLNNKHSWQKITDTDITKALADAQSAQDTADQKRRVFYTQPIPPYDTGDLWVQGSTGDILRCQITKTSSQTYSLTDWVLASKYTDDTAAVAAQATANKNASDIGELNTKVTTQGTQISVIQGQIASKIWQQDIDTASNEMTTKYSTLEQEVDSISATVASHTSEISQKADSSTVTTVNDRVTTLETDLDGFQSNVSSTYATKNALATTNNNVTTAQNTANSAVSKADAAQADIDALDVGGRNLWYNPNETCEIVDLEPGNPTGFDKAYHLTGSSQVCINRFNAFTEELVGKQLTMQCWIKYENVVAGVDPWNSLNIGKLSMRYTLEDGSVTAYHYDSIIAASIAGSSDGWVFMKGTKQLRSDVVSVNLGNSSPRINLEAPESGEVWVTGIKLEFGNVATDWTPPPEEVEDNVFALEERVSSAETIISQNSEAIKLRALKTEVSSAKAEAISTASSDATTKANNALSSANANTAALLENYSTTADMEAAIELKADSIASSVSSTYATKSALATTNSNVTAAKNAADAAQEDVDTLSKTVSSNYATKSELTQTSNSITSSVSSTYATKSALATTNTNVTAAQNAANAAQEDVDTLSKTVASTYATKSELTQTSNSITSSVSSTYATKSALATTNANLATAQSTADAAKKKLYHSASGTSATVGYVGFAELTVSNHYMNRPICFSLENRGRNASNVEVRFKNVASNDPDLQNLRENGDINVWIVKLETSKWRVIAQKSEGYDTIYVVDYSNNNGGVSVDWVNVHYDTLPTDNITTSTKLIGSAVASTIATKSEITQLSDRITANVTETTNLGTRMSTVEQTASGLTARLTTAESDIDTAQSTANTAKTNAATAQSTANTAKTNAATAQTTANNAAKTATNYLNFSSSGLVVGDMTASSLGKNVLIDSDSVDIRNGTNVLASFGANKVTLGQNSADSVIDLCEGAGKISALISEASTSYPKYDSIEIASQEINTSSQRFVTNVTNSYNVSSTPAIQNDAQIYMLSDKSSAGSFARMEGMCTTTATGAEISAGVSAIVYDTYSTTRLMVYAHDSTDTLNRSNMVNVYPHKTTMNKPLYINGTAFTGENKVLWSGGYYMSANQTATLSEAISAQANGIVLIWSYYVDGANDNSNFHSFFVPKHFVSVHNGKGLSMFLANASLSIAAGKYVYISDTSIKGYSSNNANAAAKDSGLTASPKYFVLRYVIGV